MTPLEKARKEENKIQCKTCKNCLLLNNIYYCEVSGKMIIPYTLDCNRKEQCKNRYKKMEERK